MLLFVLIFSISFILFSLKNLKSGLLFFIFLIPITPRYIGLALGSEDFVLSLKRIFVPSLLILLMVLMKQKPEFKERYMNIFKTQKKIIYLILGLFFLKFVSTFLNSPGDIAAIVQLFNEFIFTIVIFIATFVLITEKKDINRVLVLFAVGVFFSELISIVEYYKQAPFLDGLVAIQVDGAESLDIGGKYRDNSYRAMGGFENPLTLAEMLNISFPIVIYVFLYNARFFFLNLIVLCLLPLSIYFTGSRAGLALLPLTVVLLIWFHYYTNINKSLRKVFFGISLIGALGVAYKLYGLGVEYYNQAEKGLMAGDTSVLERVNQYTVVGALISAKPIIGYGFKRNYAQGLDDMSNLDNYYLRLGLEAGYLGILLFVFTLIYVLYLIFMQIKRDPDKRNKAFYKAIFLSIFAFLISKLFLSMPTNNMYFYILLAIFLRYKLIVEKETTLSRTKQAGILT